MSERNTTTPHQQQQQQQQQQQPPQQRDQTHESQELGHQTTVEDMELGPPKADFSAPPPYELTNSDMIPVPQQHQLDQQHDQLEHELQQQQTDMSQQQQQQQQAIGYPIIHHSKLPTYEEVQLEKSLNGELPPAFLTGHPHHNALQPPPPPPPNPLLAHLRDGPNGNGMGGGGSPGGGGTPALTFIAIDASEAENLTSSESGLLGTDFMFVMAFAVAFFFNWIGFLMLTCFCHTIAARYGALAGFGLSLAKWTLIVKHSTDLASHENSWLWWLIMAFGLLICVRAVIQYMSIKRTWRLLSASAQERLLFFY